jgi:hypothetical protein
MIAAPYAARCDDRQTAAWPNITSATPMYIGLRTSRCSAVVTRNFVGAMGTGVLQSAHRKFPCATKVNRYSSRNHYNPDLVRQSLVRIVKAAHNPPWHEHGDRPRHKDREPNRLQHGSKSARHHFHLRDRRTNLTVKLTSTEEIRTQPECSRVDAFLRSIPSTSIPLRIDAEIALRKFLKWIRRDESWQ